MPRLVLRLAELRRDVDDRNRDFYVGGYWVLITFLIMVVVMTTKANKKEDALIDAYEPGGKQTLEEVLKDLVTQEDIYAKQDKQKELLALYRFRIKLEQKLKEMEK